MKASTKSKHSYWMVKQEPETYSWDDFVKDGSTDWSGVRNYQARNNLRAMKPGDRVLFYHSGKGKEVVGLAEVIKGAYPDPTADDPQVAFGPQFQAFPSVEEFTEQFGVMAR